MKEGNTLFQRLDYRVEETKWSDLIYEDHLAWVKKQAGERFFVGGGLNNLATKEGTPGCLFEAKDNQEAEALINADPLIAGGLYRYELHKWHMFIYSQDIFERESKMYTKEKIASLIREMIAVNYCADELKEAGQAWLDTKDSEEASTATAALVVELKECIVPIDDAIALARSFPDDDFWKGILEAELKAKEEGAKICGCVACRNGQEILDNI
jgi:uncharacterized protein YciI